VAMLNRHGLVAGATGTGKTKTIQGLAGRLSDAGVPCFVADLKGDVSGMAEPGEPTQGDRLHPAARGAMGPASVPGGVADAVRRPGQGGAGAGLGV
jgi:DNA helicase HerA-like ATPase